MNFNTNILVCSLVAVTSLSLICTVKAVADGLLRTSSGSAGPPFSSTLYVLWLNAMSIANEWMITFYFTSQIIEKWGYKCDAENFTESIECTISTLSCSTTTVHIHTIYFRLHIIYLIFSSFSKLTTVTDWHAHTIDIIDCCD